MLRRTLRHRRSAGCRVSCRATRDVGDPPPEQQPASACSRRALLASTAAAAAAVVSTAGPQPAFASMSCAADALDARASQRSPPVGAPRPPAYAANGSAAAAQPVWDLAAVENGGIKQAPQDTSELLPFSTAETLSSAQTRVCGHSELWCPCGIGVTCDAEEHLPNCTLRDERMLTTTILSCAIATNRPWSSTRGYSSRTRRRSAFPPSCARASMSR